MYEQEINIFEALSAVGLNVIVVDFQEDKAQLEADDCDNNPSAEDEKNIKLQQKNIEK